MNCSTSLSVVTPAFNEEENIPLLYARMTAALDPLGESWEWIVVDDGSADGTNDAVARLAARDGRVRSLSRSRNGGSHAAILCGLAESRGSAILVLAGDLQDPPELCGELLGRWREGASVVWAVRRRPDRGWLAAIPSRLYHALVRRVGGARGLPAGGAGFFLLDRALVEVLIRCAPPPVDVFAAVGRLPIESAATVLYDRSARRHGRSRWSLGKKVGFALRSLVAAR